MNIELYNKIKAEYDNFYKSLLKIGKLPMRSTEKGFWGSAVSDEVFEAFKKINLQKYKNFLDLGSGDGKVVLIAALFVKNSYGIEFDKQLYNKSIEIKEKTGIQNANFFLADFFDFSFSNYDVIFCNPDSHLDKIEKKMIREFNGIFVNYGNNFYPKQLRKSGEFAINNTRISVHFNKKS